MDEQIIRNISADSVKLIKNTKGYGFEIKAYSENEDELIEKLKRLHSKVSNMIEELK